MSLKQNIAADIASLGGHLGLSRLIEGLDGQLEGLSLDVESAADAGDGGGEAAGKGVFLDSF